jgi:hypothetical protein
MLTRLCLSLYDFAKNTSANRVPKQHLTAAKPFLLPEMVIAIFDLSLDMDLLPFNESDSRSLTPQKIDMACMVLYNLMNVGFEMGVRDGAHSTSRTTPLLLRSALYDWIDFFIRADPDGMHGKLNMLLSGLQDLYDPITDKPFIHKDIPRSCFPAAGDPQVLSQWRAVQERMQSEKPEIIRRGQEIERANQPPALRDDPVTLLTNAIAQQNYYESISSKNRTETTKMTVGSWDYDTNGDRTYDQAWIQ